MTKRLSGLRILVVDEQDASRAALQALLLRQGGDVVAVPTAEDALILYEALHYDAIVSDLRLPGKDGLALLAAVRAMEQGRDRAAFAIAYSVEPPAEASRALQHGFDYVISKPAVDSLISLLGHVAAILRSV